nr:GDNF family receptor alpha-like [Leptinotarsa decemlineata]
MVFQSTCHTAMQSCNNHYHCRMLLAPILHHCEMSRCNRNSCMEALQTFYGKPDFPWNLEIAFCLCKKTDNRQDACLIAQEKLHPVCAQRVEDSPQPTCLHLAEVCRENKDCRMKLEHYEQSCAVDSVTKKCAGSPIECRSAILGILGTDLRTTCACKGTDMTQLYECLGWQRLLWVNPCVESCIVQRPQFPNHFIPEGSFKRIYHEDEFECSDVCECEIGEKLTCRTICIDRMPCKTEFAYYNHAAPAYQAFRGRCLCYSGRFICMKPMPSDYALPQGIYLFLGYSEVDERELNKNHTVIVVQDIVRVLQNFIEEEAVNGLSVFT